MITIPEEAEGYAIDIVLSELKGALESSRIASRYAGGNAIKSRLREMAYKNRHLVLQGDAKHTVDCDTVSDLIINGLKQGIGNGNLQMV